MSLINLVFHEVEGVRWKVEPNTNVRTLIITTPSGEQEITFFRKEVTEVETPPRVA